MANDIYVEQTTLPGRLRRISWGAVFAGLFVSAAIQILLTLLGASIGAATINPAQEQHPAKGLGIASVIWVLVSGLISLWVGACVAGRLSGGPRRTDGLLHGLVTWSVSTLLMLGLLTTTVGALLGGTASLLSNAIGAVQPSQPGNGVAEKIQGMASSLGIPSPTGRARGGQPGQLGQLAMQDPELGAALAKLAAKSGSDQTKEDRDKVVSLLTTRHNMSQEQADSAVSQWEQESQNMKAQDEQKLRQAGEDVTSGVSKGSLYAFIGLLLGLLVAAWGGWAGAASIPRYTETAPRPVAS